MSHLQKLTIKGVRSFDPDSQQEITFFPLTLIHGPNGSGKTTIIEALKYATTGTLPDNCNSGRSFVHDVKFADKATIKGKVRLQYTDVDQRPTVVCRRMQTSFRQPRNGQPQTVTFTQLNSVIKRLDEGGGRHPHRYAIHNANNVNKNTPENAKAAAAATTTTPSLSSPLTPSTPSPSPSLPSLPPPPSPSSAAATPAKANASTPTNANATNAPGDINNEVLASLGVNRALLNSVIFCHQEDTNWPLAEGKVLRERLNGVFGTDGYLERLEQIRQARDRETKAFYVLEREVQHVVLAKRKEAIKRKELSDEQARTDQEKRRVAELEAEAKTLQDRLDSLTVKEARVESASNAILEIRRSLEDMHNMARAIEGTCNPAILAKSNDQVNEELEHFDENALQMLARKRELEAKLEKLEAEHSRLVYDRQRISLERAKANECANTIFKLFADRNALIATSIKCNSPEFHSILAKCNSNNNNNNVGGASPSCALNNNHNNNNGGGVSLISNLNANKLNNAERNYVLLQFDAQLDQLSALANEKRSGMQIQEYKLMQELDSLKNLKSNASHEKAIWQIQLQKAEREQAQLERTMAAHHLHNHHNHLHNHHGHSHSPHSQHNHGLHHSPHSNLHHSPHHALHHVNVNIVHPPNVNNNNNNSITSNNNNHLIVGGGLNSHSPSPMVSTPTSSPSNTSSPSLITTLTPSSSSSSSMSSLPMGSLNSIFDGQIKSLAEKADAYRAQLANQFDAGAEEKLASAIAQLETQAAELRAGIEANRARLEATLATAKEKAEYDYYRRLRAEKVARLEAIRVQKLAHVFGAHALEQQHHQLHSAGTSSSSASASPSVSHSPLSNLNYSTIINSSSSISDTFYELLEKAASDQENYASRVSAYENELCSKRCKLESQQELLSRRIKELDANKSKFDGVCSIHTFEAFLKGKEIELHQLRDERAKHSGKAPVIEKQVETIRHCDHCPVCEKEISVASGGWTSKKTAQPVDKQSLIEGLRRSTAEGQQEVKRLEVQIAASERLVAKLGKLRSSYEAIQHVTREIILIKGELPSLREQVSLFQKTVEEERGHLRASRSRVEALRRCTRDVVEYDSSLRELADLERKLASFDTSKWPAEDGGTGGGGGGGSLTGSGGAGTPNSCAGGTPEHHPATSNSSPAPPKPPSAEQLNHHLQQLQHHLEQTTARLGELQKESLRFTKDKMLLQTLLQAVERSKSELEVQDQMAGMKRRNEIVAEVNEAKGKIVALEGRAATEFDPKIDRLEGQLRALAGELSSTEKDNHHAVFAIQEASKKLKTIFNEIDRYSYDLAQSQAITSPEQVEKLNREMEQFEETKKMFSQQLTEATQAIGNLELQKRELFDCKRYINLQKNLREGEDRLREEEARLGNTSLLEAKASCSSTYSQLAMLRSQIAVSQERLRAGEQRLAAMEAKLARGGGYAAADRRHREKLLEKTVTELAIEDLNRYYRALDHSVVAYHRSKMEEVNRLLVSFWQVAYQGGDIDHISIVASPSMAEEEAAASSVPPSSSSTSTLTAATTTTSSSSSFTPTSTNSTTTTTTSSTDDTQLLSSSSSTMTTATSATPTTTSATSSSSSSLLASMTAPLGRRSFTYRVVMVKKGKVMNMRGRCSAGQKVLASFIIRLALAVIFARERFAVLTLDEPTTNLDKANIQAFSRAVISLIRSNRHFQIIIITHDSEFLQCLNAHTGEFYEVLKDYKGFSTIVRKSTSEVHLTGFPAIKIDRRRGPRKRKNLDGGVQEAGDVPLKWAPKRARLAPPPVVVVPAAATPVQPQQQQQQQQQPQQQQGQQRPKPPVHKLLSSALHNNSSAIQPIQQLNGVGGSGGIQVLLPPPPSQLPASTQTPTATATSSSSSSSSASSSSSFPVTSLSSSTATTTSSTSSQL